MDKELWYIYTMEYYSTIKRNTFESVLMRWMNLEPEEMMNLELGPSREFQKNVYFCFIDYAKVLDCMDHNKL